MSTERVLRLDLDCFIVTGAVALAAMELRKFFSAEAAAERAKEKKRMRVIFVGHAN